MRCSFEQTFIEEVQDDNWKCRWYTEINCCPCKLEGKWMVLIKFPEEILTLWCNLKTGYEYKELRTVGKINLSASFGSDHNTVTTDCNTPRIKCDKDHHSLFLLIQISFIHAVSRIVWYSNNKPDY